MRRSDRLEQGMLTLARAPPAFAQPLWSVAGTHSLQYPFHRSCQCRSGNLPQPHLRGHLGLPIFASYPHAHRTISFSPSLGFHLRPLAMTIAAPSCGNHFKHNSSKSDLNYEYSFDQAIFGIREGRDQAVVWISSMEEIGWDADTRWGHADYGFAANCIVSGGEL